LNCQTWEQFLISSFQLFCIFSWFISSIFWPYSSWLN
jgi:hypothetical protein